jgi:hypothetical protein
MLIAQQKLQENIAEYIIYMYQIEDIIRSFNLDINLIMNEFINPQIQDDLTRLKYKKWYEDLIRQMKSQKISESGHLFLIQEIIIELSFLHNTLLNLPNSKKYKELFEKSIDHIEAFKEKSNLKNKNHIEIAFHALYMKLLLKLKKTEISIESEESFNAIRDFLAFLSKAYHEMKNGNFHPSQSPSFN